MYRNELPTRPEGEVVSVCTCHPCTTPGYGAPGHVHCAACCYGTLIAEYNPDCPIAEHQALAERQYPTQNQAPGDAMKLYGVDSAWLAGVCLTCRYWKATIGDQCEACATGDSTRE